MTSAIVKLTTPGGFPLFYSGKAGNDWLCESEAEAFQYLGFEAAQRKADQLAKIYAGTGMTFTAIEARQVCSAAACLLRGSRWDLYLFQGEQIHAIPTERARLAGVRSSYFGNREHLRRLIQAGELAELEGFTEQGLQFLAGLACGIRGGALTFQAA